jgi:hypothetical protein
MPSLGEVVSEEPPFLLRAPKAVIPTLLRRSIVGELAGFGRPRLGGNRLKRL